MALKLPVKPLKLSAMPPKPVPKPAPEPVEDRSPPKSITVRMPSNHTAMLEACMEHWECDKSEGVKRAIRLAFSVLSAKDAKLILIDAETGVTTTQQLVKNGVAC